MLNNKEQDEIEKLFDKAQAFYLDKTDFDAIEWLDKKEAQRYLELQNKQIK